MLKNIRCWNCREWAEFYSGDAFNTRKTDEGLIVNHYSCPNCGAEICVDVNDVKDTNENQTTN